MTDGEAVGCANPYRRNNRLWCATKVDSDGMIASQGTLMPNWGFCDMDMDTCKKNGMIHFHLAISSWPRGNLKFDPLPTWSAIK